MFDVCVGFWRVDEATVRSNGARSVRGEVECRWVRAVMEVGERSNGVRTVSVEMRVERRGEMRWIIWGVKTDGVKTEEMRVERRGDKLWKKLVSGSGYSENWISFLLQLCHQKRCLLFKMWPKHVSKIMFQTKVFEQLFSNNPFLNTITKQIVPNFGH